MMQSIHNGQCGGGGEAIALLFPIVPHHFALFPIVPHHSRKVGRLTCHMYKRKLKPREVWTHTKVHCQVLKPTLLAIAHTYMPMWLVLKKIHISLWAKHRYKEGKHIFSLN